MSVDTNSTGFYELYTGAVESPELDRVVKDMARHIRKGKYEPDRAVRAVYRFVVEPTAIKLGEGKVWWKVYGKELREEVSRRIVRSWEREIAEGGG